MANIETRTIGYVTTDVFAGTSRDANRESPGLCPIISETVEDPQNSSRDVVCGEKSIREALDEVLYNPLIDPVDSGIEGLNTFNFHSDYDADLQSIVYRDLQVKSGNETRVAIDVIDGDIRIRHNGSREGLQIIGKTSNFHSSGNYCIMSRFNLENFSDERFAYVSNESSRLQFPVLDSMILLKKIAVKITMPFATMNSPVFFGCAVDAYGRMSRPLGYFKSSGTLGWSEIFYADDFLKRGYEVFSTNEPIKCITNILNGVGEFEMRVWFDIVGDN